MSKELVAKEIDEWYEDYYERKGVDRNDLLQNPGVLFQALTFDVSMIAALRTLKLDPKASKILDVGCGDGTSLMTFFRLGFDPSNMYGIDILERSIAEGQRKIPSTNLLCGNAASMPFPDNTFDMTFESQMFIQVIDDDLSKQIANEMLRVTMIGGYIILIDWRYSKPNNPDYRGLSKKRIEKLFSIGDSSKICRTFNGALVPPIGRFLSKNMYFMYYVIHFFFPFLVGQKTTVLQKIKAVSDTEFCQP